MSNHRIRGTLEEVAALDDAHGEGRVFSSRCRYAPIEAAGAHEHLTPDRAVRGHQVRDPARIGGVVWTWLQDAVQLEVAAKEVPVPSEDAATDPSQLLRGILPDEGRAEGADPTRFHDAVVVREEEDVSTACVDSSVARSAGTERPFVSQDPDGQALWSYTLCFDGM